MTDRISLERWAMALATVTANRSTCLRRSVGAVLLNAHGQVLATGYNGVASGQHHCHEALTLVGQPGSRPAVVYPHACPGAGEASGTNLDLCQAIHAEQNALLQCRNVYEIHTAVVTTAPCLTCTKLLMNTACVRIIYAEDYPQAEQARELWLADVNAKRRWQQLARIEDD